MRSVIRVLHRVPVLIVTVLSIIPVALWWDWRPWIGSDAARPVDGAAFDPMLWHAQAWKLGGPSVGQWLVVALVLYTVVDAVRGMIEDLRHGHLGVDILAVIAMLSTLAVQEYWASWAVVLMVWSGEAIEEYAQAKASSNLSALVSAAPHEAHLAVAESGAEALSDTAVHDGDRRAPIASTDTAGHGGSHRELAAGVDAPSGMRTIGAEAVEIGDVLIVLPGETVPVDGALLSDESTLDLSAINGEPLPRTVYSGARVMSGAVNGSRALRMRATTLARDSQYQHILRMVASARDSRARAVTTADRMAVPFTALSLVIAGLAWFVSRDPTRFAQVLVLATPCPLLIAAPVAYLAGTGRLAKAGILVKTQDVIENLGRVTHAFFDKTGTLTSSRPHVLRVEMASGAGAAGQPGASAADSVSDPAAVPRDADQVLAIAGLIEGYSVHILAQGIASAGIEARRRLAQRGGFGNERAAVIRDVHEDPGNGVSGTVDGRRVRVGRLGYVTAMPESDARARFSHHGCRPIAPDEMAAFVSFDGRLVARIVLRDTPRENARPSLDRLRELGVVRLTMLTGDHMASAGKVAREVGIDDVRADLLPQDKLRALGIDAPEVDVLGVDAADGAASNGAVPNGAASGGIAISAGAGSRRWSRRGLRRGARRAKTRVAMMVGDGVNDAPVLAAADVGVAITDGTSTAAAQSAHVVIMDDDLSAVPRAIAIARRTQRVMLQAVVGGLALALACMLAAAWDLIPVVVGAFVQEAIDVVSILWALTALTGPESRE